MAAAPSVRICKYLTQRRKEWEERGDKREGQGAERMETSPRARRGEGRRETTLVLWVILGEIEF